LWNKLFFHFFYQGERMSKTKYRAFTLVELLVVIAIIGILVGLLLPAVQAAREAARRMQCTNNLKQIGLAVHTYVDAQRKFPSGFYFQGLGMTSRADRPRRKPGFGWTSSLLPYVEQSSIFNQLNFNVGMSLAPNRLLVASNLPFAVCPSAANPSTNKRMGTTGTGFGFSDPGLAVTNYVGCGGSFTGSAYYSSVEAAKNGIIMEDTNFSFESISDGTSNTIMAGETVYYGTGTDGSFLWDPTWFGHYQASGGRADAPEAIMRVGQFRSNPPSVASADVKRNSFSSKHVGGSNFVLGDGSVHFISQTVQHTESPYSTALNWANVGVFQRLCSRNDGQVVSGFDN
jgi:prepilin-type N-terminal cleavage/methylation domain-containing protein